MRYVFIVNPKAGSRNRTDEVRKAAEEYFGADNRCYTVYETTGKGEATEIAKAESGKGDRVRIYGYGGDGTLLEIVRGAQGRNNAEVGIFPTGSGNDYVRTYGEAKDFLDFNSQIEGRSIAVDMIDTLGGTAINICSVGLDAKVAYEMTGFKKIPGVKGSLAYDLSLAKCLFGKVGQRLHVRMNTPEGEVRELGEYIFVLAAAGKCYGGGYMGAPKAVTNDGLLDFILIKKPPLHKIPSLVGIYKKGEHLSSPKFKDYLSCYRGSEMELVGTEEMYCNRDGECDKVSKELFSLSKGSLNFILPKGLEYGIKPIKTQRLVIRNWREEDFKDYCAYAMDPEVTLPAGRMPCKNEDEARGIFTQLFEERLCMAIEYRPEGRVIGGIGLQPDFRRWQVNSKCVGYELNKDYWGKGIMTEALSAVVSFAFEEQGLEVLGIFHFTDNEKSKKVIEKCGFSHEGTLRKGFRRRDSAVFDEECYSITREEYFKQKAD